MSRIKQLKSESINNINIIELLSVFCEKSKYIETLLRIIKNEKKFKTNVKEIKSFLINDLQIDNDKLNNISDEHLLFFNTFFEFMAGIDEIKNYKKFIEYNERGLIENNDLSTYKSFNQILNNISIAEIKDYEKELKGQIIKIFEDDEWIIIKPLSYESSKKYGSNTKWCTASSQTSDYFNNYTKNGILIYIINKKTGKKIGLHKSYGKNVTYWNQEDKNIEQDNTNLPIYITTIIQKSLRDERSNLMLYKLKINEKNVIQPEFSERKNRLNNKILNAISRNDSHIMTELPIKIKK